MKKFLVQTKVGEEVFTEVMTRDELLRVVDVNLSADYIDDMKIFDVSEFGAAREVDLNEILPRPVIMMIVEV